MRDLVERYGADLVWSIGLQLFRYPPNLDIDGKQKTALELILFQDYGQRRQ